MLIKLGSTGNNVIKLQEKLCINVNGLFDLNTEKSVKEWQSKNGLTNDGVVGNKTWSKIFNSKPIEDIKLTTINLEKLKGSVPDSVINQIHTIIEKFNCNTPLRLAHFLAQCGHESGSFKSIYENLNYSEKGLLKTFKKYFTPTLAKKYAKNPEMIASRVYGGRMGNGDEASKEGWKFRGRGFIQLTGKSNYISFMKFINEDCVENPDLVANKYPLASAAFFFDKNKLWSICDKGTSNECIKELTKRINGGDNGLEDRIIKFNKFWALLK